MQIPKISVVLCTFNGEKYAAQQIESIINQSILPDELIISDDCSTDATVDIISFFSKNYPSIVRFVQSEKNLGFIKNFEKAISLSKGEIIFLSDQDDVWFNQKIEFMLRSFLDHEEIVLVYSDAILTNSALEPTNNTLFHRRKSLLLDKKRSASMLVRGVGVNGCTMAFRSILKEIILPIERGWGHDHWIAFIAHAVGAVEPIDKPLMYYRRHKASAGNDPLLEGGRLKVWKTGINAISHAEYERDLNRWKSILQRLCEIMEKQSVSWVDYINLGVFLRECERRTELALARKQIKEKTRFGRLPGVFHLYFSGYYQQYLNGMKSLLKDLFL